MDWSLELCVGVLEWSLGVEFNYCLNSSVGSVFARSRSMCPEGLEPDAVARSDACPSSMRASLETMKTLLMFLFCEIELF